MLGMVLFTSIYVSAQQDQKAKVILGKVSENTRSCSSITADFLFSMQNNELEVDENYEGSIIFKGNRNVVVIKDIKTKEILTKIYSNCDTIWNYMSGGNQVTISNQEDEGTLMTNPSSLFSFYEKDFESKYIAEATEDGETVCKIELYPNSEEHDVSRITVSINKSTMMIQSATLFEINGNLYRIKLNNLETDKDIPNSDFVFDASKYDDIEIIDLR